MTETDRFRVIFVCTGNICRSPMAEAVLRDIATAHGLGDRVLSSSAGTGDWHVGERADARTLDALTRRGYDGSQHRARQFTYDSFAENDLVIALDRTHERSLRQWARDESEEGKVSLLLSFDHSARELDVFDPYYADARTFDEVLSVIEGAVHALFRQLEPALRAAPLSGEAGRRRSV
ncbi:low molecular weight protein-tyrosine-phosphatase [Microbacterium pseudoresistens]|uniref:protein-tyrosine-phosphatase n=1 Tax=Microbacterium pseudoresistens TaxID=640634 RepID=A0A7Y9JLW3_9MICO|nr:low molecular weight protein-tyrosine-phosphatase [Microbacterium pseudoresistens]NYD54142.1 protein-tyrosine phosphatase [Microbacterium pseudoresistens]